MITRALASIFVVILATMVCALTITYPTVAHLIATITVAVSASLLVIAILRGDV